MLDGITMELGHDRASCPWCSRLAPFGSASKLDGLRVCPAAAVFPQVARAGKRPARRGRALHEFLAAVPTIGRKAALEKVPKDFRDDAAVIDLEQLRGLLDPKAFASEVALAYNVDTGMARVLGQGLDRKYDVCVREIPGTPDVLGLTSDAVVLPDYKSGYASFEPERMWQLLMYSLMACRAFNKQRAVTGIIRLRDDGSSYWQKAEFDAVRLAEFELELQDLVHRVDAARAEFKAGRMPALVESEHCKRCNAFDFCPAKMNLARQFASAPLELEKLLAAATPEQLGAAWDRVTAVEAVVGRVKEALKERALGAPIPLPDGQVVGPIPTERCLTETTSMVLEALHGQAVAEAAQVVTVEVSKKSIEAALREHVYEKGVTTLKDLKETTFEAIREAGGFEVGQQIRAHRPKSLKE